MSYTITRTNASAWPQITIAPLAVDTTSTSLTLWGRGAINWGQLEQSNFVHLLENFAGPSAPLHPLDGQVWYDTSDPTNKVLRVYNYNMTTGTGSWNVSGAAGAGTSYPTPAAVGQLWYNTTISQLMACTTIDSLGNGTWIPVSLSFISTTAPAIPLLGQLWFNASTNNLEYYSGTTSGWQVVVGNSSGTIAPSNPKVGQLWFNTNTSILNFWNGNIWEPLNGTIVLPGTVSGPHGPIGLPVGYTVPVGQFWFNTTNNTLEFWDGANWEVPGVVIGAQAPQNPRVGQFWFNSISDQLSYNDQNGVWQTISINYSGTTAPSPATAGQLWYNSLTTTLEVFDGASWVPAIPAYTAGYGITIVNNVVSAIPNWAIGLVFS